MQHWLEVLNPDLQKKNLGIIAGEKPFAPTPAPGTCPLPAP
jgi:hypothetical protein